MGTSIKTLNVFKTSYKVVRKNSDEIYKGFGFKHLSDATHYYVHPENQSFDGTTTLCQPIGESLILFSSMLHAFDTDKPFGDYYVNDDNSVVVLKIDIPNDYRDNGVVDKRVYRYVAACSDDKISIAAYDDINRWIDGDMERLGPLYKLLPVFMVLLAKERGDNSDLGNMMDGFIHNPSADVFVNLHEDFYQLHKFQDYNIEYTNLAGIDMDGLQSYYSTYATISENINQGNVLSEVEIVPFPDDTFTSEQKKQVPHLGKEFVLPKELRSVCNAISSGDMCAILLHGPAGTGKTMSCKLIADAIGLPICETINCTENLDEFVLGKYIPQDEKIIFKESYVTEAIRSGGGVVFEEINFAKPQHLAFLNSLLDDNGFVRLDNGEVVKRNPNFRFFATMNIGYFGTKELNQALYNRFNGIIEVAELSDEAIARMLTTRVSECKNVVDKVISVYHKIKKKIESEELEAVISPRNLENWVRLAKYDGYVRAAEKTIIQIAKCDRALETSIRGIVRLYKWE